MQCTECQYEPTLSEMQRSQDACIKCGAKYDGSEQGRHTGPAQVGRRKGRGLLIPIILLLSVSAAGFFGYSIYQERVVAELVGKEVKLTSAYVSQVLTALDGAGSMTFAEFFSKANKAVEEIDSIALRLSVIEPQNQTTAAGISYTKKAQEVIRGTSSSMRAMMRLSNARDREQAARLRAISSNEYIREAGYDALEDALNDQIEALDEIKKVRSGLAASAIDLRAAGEQVKGVDSSSLVSPPLLDKLIKSSE